MKDSNNSLLNYIFYIYVLAVNYFLILEITCQQNKANNEKEEEEKMELRDKFRGIC